MERKLRTPIVNWIDYHNMVDCEIRQVQYIKDTYVYQLQEKIERLKEDCKTEQANAEYYRKWHEQDLEVIKGLEEALSREVQVRDENHKLLHDRIDKALAILEEGVKFCENDSQGVYDKCNIAINRERKAIAALKGEMSDGQE